ncbi:MAG: 16S rRNA (guanine(966)-N(2))-methyltransferase RsmD, partial [Gemmatimonadetes bacterium]
APADPQQTAALASDLHIPEPLAAILVQRGLAAPEHAKAFLRPDLERLSDPRAWADMPRAVELIVAAVRSGAPILVHGDYDVDGQCGAALLTRVLSSVGGRAHAFVPHRLRDGYDFGPAGLAEARRVGAGLIITCDCGITAVEAVRAARAAGIDVIITDHHLPGDELPPASAVLDPRRADCPSEDKELCGTGVAFKLAQALVPTLGVSPHLPLHFLDLVALATVADVVPLTGENRILVRHGLKLLAQSHWTGVRALVETAGLTGKPIKSGHVGFILAPRLNAAGRIGDANDGLRLLLSDDPQEAAAIARELETLNARRQALDQRILDEAVELAERVLQPDDRALVLAADAWHPGVIGIVASRLVERYGRPTFLIGWEEGSEVGRGSGRSGPRERRAGEADSLPRAVRSRQSSPGVRRAPGPRGRCAACRDEPPALHAGRRVGGAPRDRVPMGRRDPRPLARGAAGRRLPPGARRVAGADDAAGAGGGDGAERMNAERGRRNAEQTLTLPFRVPRSHFRVGKGAGQGMIRIIAGDFKGRRLKTPSSDAVRPTGDRVREAWFSILQRPLRGARVLDLFAGSGALGLEALSRGAVSADFVEIHRLALSSLKANITLLKVDDRTVVHRVDALAFAEHLHAGQYDVAFADPPYAGGQAARLVALFRVNPFARIISIEHPANQPIPGDDTRRYGDTAVTFIYAP